MPITAKLTQGKNCFIDPRAYIGYNEHGGQIILGNAVKIMHDCIIRTCTGIIKLDNLVSVGYGTIMHGLGNITVGEGTLISPRVQIYAQNHGIAGRSPIRNQPQTSKGITIGKHAWIGAGAILLDGITIGEGAVVGAGAVVSDSIGPFEIWVGNPAKKVGERR